MKGFLSAITLLLLLACSGGASDPPVDTTTPPADTSEYRQATYGLPDHYCDPTRPLTSTGTGTLSDPWNYAQCQSEPLAGEVIGHLPVGAGVPVRLQSTKGSGDQRQPAFDPLNPGMPGSPIVHVSKFPAVTLDYATISTNPQRTEIRHDGTPDASDIPGTGGAVFGSNGHDYIVYDGFFIDMAQAHITSDSGVFTCRETTGVEFRNFVIKGEITDVDSNAVVYRPDSCLGTVVSNFIVRDFTNRPTGVGLNQSASWSNQYGDENFLIEHFVIEGLDRGPYMKGFGDTRLSNYGTFRHGILNNVHTCFQLNVFNASHISTIHNVLCTNYRDNGIFLSAETQPPEQLLVHHVTIANGCTSSANCSGPIAMADHSSIGANIVFRDNVFDLLGPSSGSHSINALAATFPFPIADYNGHYTDAGTVTWAYNGETYSSIASWRTASGQEYNSRVLSSDPFVSRASHDYQVRLGHEAKTASSTGTEIGAYGESEQPIGVKAIPR